MKIPRTAYALGVVDTQHRIQEFEVPFHNAGGGSLSISAVKTDCDCTTVSYPDVSLAAKQKGLLKVRVDMTNFFPSNIEKKIAVYSNGSSSPVVITITAQVR